MGFVVKDLASVWESSWVYLELRVRTELQVNEEAVGKGRRDHGWTQEVMPLSRERTGVHTDDRAFFMLR